jgi:hypothetical protein
MISEWFYSTNLTFIMIVQFEVTPLDIMTGDQCIPVKKTVG